MPKEKKKKGFFDYSLVFIVIFLIGFGSIMIYSASSYTAQLKFGDSTYFMKRQLIIAAGGFLVMLIASKIDYHWIIKDGIIHIILLLAYAFMIAVYFVGIERNGERRWLGYGILSFQPTEYVKMALILYLAYIMPKIKKKSGQIKALFQMVAIPFLVPLFLVTMSNLSSGIILVTLIYVISWIVLDNNTLHLIGIIGASILIAIAKQVPYLLLKFHILEEYQLNRLLVWVDPEAYATSGGYQVLQGLYAVASGGIFGKGIGEGLQKFFVPEAQNDMIFSIICEELGLFGAVSLIVVFIVLLFRCNKIATCAPDIEGSLIVIGVMVHIAIQVVLNIAVVLNIIPNTGIIFPFVSYGGSSILFVMTEIGLVLSVSGRIVADA